MYVCMYVGTYIEYLYLYLPGPGYLHVGIVVGYKCTLRGAASERVSESSRTNRYTHVSRQAGRQAGR